jgi:hypothetical protein
MKMTFSSAIFMGAALLISSHLAASSPEMVVEKVDAPFPTTASGGSAPLIEEVPSFTDSQVADFEIRQGERMRYALERWTKMVGYTLIWLPEPEAGDITFATKITYRDTFNGASEDFFKVVRTQTKFDGQVHENGVLRVFVASDNQ